jgi:polysaccharide biosynthesis protein PslG
MGGGKQEVTTVPRTSRRRRELLLALLTLCAFSALTVPSAQAAAPEWRGVQLHSLWWDGTNSEMDRELDLARDAGSNVVRVDVGWSSLETSGKGPGGWYLDKLDRLVAGAGARGLKVLPVVMSTPCWASSAPESLRQGCTGSWWEREQIAMYPPTNNQDFADITVYIAQRYAGKLAAIELWNEPNLAEDRFFIAPDEPRAYADMVKAAYPRLKQAAPSLPVLAGSLAYGNDAFVRGMYANGIKGNYDGLAIHPYNTGAPRAGSWAGIEWARSLQREAGDNAPLWITEFGWSTCRIGSGWCVTPSDQGSFIRSGFAALASEPNVKAGIVYNLRNKGTNGDSMEDNFGLVGRDFSVKPGYTALKAALTGSAPPPPPPPSNPPPSSPPPANPPAGQPSPAPATPPAGGSTAGGSTSTPGTPAKPRKRPRRRKVRVQLRQRARAALATGVAPAGKRVLVSVSGCRRSGARARARAGSDGRFSVSLGSAALLRGCRVSATHA